MRQLFSLAWSSLKSRKQATGLLLSTIILSVVFLVVMGMIASSSLYTLDCQNKDLYGEQKAVVWNLPQEQESNFHNASAWDSVGKITVFGAVVSASNSFLGMGTIDEQAIQLGHIRLTEGAFPQAENEIVLEKSAYKYLGNQPYSVGNTITLEVAASGQETPQQHTFQVVGLIDNYSSVWENAYTTYEQNDTTSIPTVSFLISEQKAMTFQEITTVWLIDGKQTSYSALRAALPKSGSVCLNTATYPSIGYFGGVGEAARSAALLVALIGGAVMVCMMVILLNGFLMSVDRRKRQLSLLRCIGATKKQARDYIFCEVFILMGIGIPAGMGLGIPLSLGTVRLFSAWNHVTLFYRFNGWVLLAAILICALCVCMAVAIPAFRASRVVPVTGVRPVYFKTKMTHKSPKSRINLSPFTMMLISMRKSKGKTLLTAFTFALVIVVFNIMMMLDVVDYQNNTTEKAGATLSAMEYSAHNPHEILWKNSSKTVAIPDSVFSDFRFVPDVNYQNATVIPKFYCRIPFSHYDSYLNGLFGFDYKMLGIRQWKTWGQYAYVFEKQTPYGYSEQEYLTTPSVTIFDDALLEKFQSFVTDGAIDITAIQQGKEIILCMPEYYSVVQEEENGIQIGTRIPNGKTDIPPGSELMTNTIWKAGDTLTFTWVEETETGYHIQDRTVKIGAIVKSAPPVERSSNGIFSMAVGEETLANLQVPYEIMNVYLYFNRNADIPSAEAAVRQKVIYDYPLAQISTQTEVAMAEQQQRRTKLAVTSMLTLCLMALGFLGLMNTVSSRIFNRTHEIGLLRCIGMTKEQVYRMLLYEGAALGLLSSLLGAAVCVWMLPKFQENWIQTQMPLYLTMSCILCMTLAVGTIYLPARAVMKKNPTETIRMTE